MGSVVSSVWLDALDPGEPYRTVALTLAAVYIALPALRGLAEPLARWVRLKISTQTIRPPDTKDIVHLYMFPRDVVRQHINLSPYAVKLETWMRLYNIPYKVVETLRFSPSNGKMPYIFYNGEEVSDSAAIIQYISEKFGLDPLEGGNEEEKGITRAFQRMTDESLATTYFTFRYHYRKDEFIRLFRIRNYKFLTKMLLGFLGKAMLQRLMYTGFGRLTTVQLGLIGQEDIKAISCFLGSKPFMFGDTPRTLDCVVFAHLSHIVYVDVAFPHKDILDTDCSNIMPYMERMKARLWPDWHTVVNMERHAP